MRGVSVKNVSVTYSGRKALKNITAEFPPGSLSIVVGLNGSGKTTLIKVVAGLVNYSGNVFIGGVNSDNVPPNLRGVSYVPQNNALIPNLRVWHNIAIGLIDRERDPQIIKERVEEVAEVLGIQHLLNRYPRELSGGEARRVAIARALVVDSDVLLMDEPELSVDIQTWQTILNTILRMSESGKTVIISTHNFEDLMPYTNVMCLLHEGYALFSGYLTNLRTEDLPLDVRAWLGTVVEADDIECGESSFCVTLFNGHKIYAGSYKANSRKYLRVAILPKYVVVDQKGPLRGRIVRKIGYYAGRLTVLVDVNGYELVATSHEALQEGSVASLKIEKAIPLGGSS
ncbi:MAG: ATP-binding cassette domain-containing protein [Thermoprotei archaeon]